MTLPTSCPQCQSWFRPCVQQSSKCLCVPHPHCIFSCRGPWVPLEEDLGRGLPWTLWSLLPRGSAPLQAMSSACKDRLRSGNRARDCDFLLLGPPSAVGSPGLDFRWCTLRHALVCSVDSSPRVQALCVPGTAAALQPGRAPPRILAFVAWVLHPHCYWQRVLSQLLQPPALASFHRTAPTDCLGGAATPQTSVGDVPSRPSPGAQSVGTHWPDALCPVWGPAEPAFLHRCLPQQSCCFGLPGNTHGVPAPALGAWEPCPSYSWVSGESC